MFNPGQNQGNQGMFNPGQNQGNQGKVNQGKNQDMNFNMGHNNQNMINNQMNQNNNNFPGNNNNNNNNNNIQMAQQNNQNQNQNMDNNFTRKHYQTKAENSIMPSITQNSNLIDKNEVNEINNIVQQVYSYKINQKEENDFMSDIICQKIKHKIHGDWFVFISDINNNIPFSFSTISESDFLIITLGKTKFQIAKLK